MSVKVGTFNLNNLFSRWNLYVEVGETGVAELADAPPRAWLADAPPAEPGPAVAASGASKPKVPDVRITIDGTRTPEGIKWRTNPADGRLVFKKRPAAQKLLADRIKAIKVDVLACQEVENIEALDEFVRVQALDKAGYRHRVLVEGNDERLIDVAVLSKLPIGPVTSWRHRTYKNGKGKPVFSRDLLQVDILSPDRSKTLFTLYNNHLKSQLGAEGVSDARRRKQAETIATILSQNPPPGPYIVVGDMNDTPDSEPLSAIAGAGLVGAIFNPTELGGPYDPTDPDQPTTTAWSHRFRSAGVTRYDLYDQIWVSPNLKKKIKGSFVHRRTKRGGDASDHDPVWIELDI